MIHLEGCNIIVPIQRLAKCRRTIRDIGTFLQERMASGRNCWHDDYLYREGAVDAADLQLRLFEWARYGLSLTRRNDVGEEWNDLCVVDGAAGPTLPCRWLKCNMEKRTAWLAGTRGDENHPPKTIVFLHGKESTPRTSSSARAVVEYFKHDTVLVPDYRPLVRSHAEIEEFLSGFVADAGPDVTVVGISLGGYWAYRIASLVPAVSGCIMLNPSFRCYPDLPIPDPRPGLPLTLIVNLDDEVVDPAPALELFTGHAEITSFSRGGHRFENRRDMLREIELALDDLCE